MGQLPDKADDTKAAMAAQSVLLSPSVSVVWVPMHVAATAVDAAAVPVHVMTGVPCPSVHCAIAAALHL